MVDHMYGKIINRLLIILIDKLFSLNISTLSCVPLTVDQLITILNCFPQTSNNIETSSGVYEK